LTELSLAKNTELLHNVRSPDTNQMIKGCRNDERNSSFKEFIVSIPFLEGGFVSTDYASTALLISRHTVMREKGVREKR
jgi:hypothetical protein